MKVPNQAVITICETADQKADGRSIESPQNVTVTIVDSSIEDFCTAPNSPIDTSRKCPYSSTNTEDSKINSTSNGGGGIRQAYSEGTWKIKSPADLDNLTEEEILDLAEAWIDQLKNIPESEKRKWILDKMVEAFKDTLPMTLIEILAAYSFDGDSGISMDSEPGWLDKDKFRRGQKFAMEYMFGITYAELMSLFIVFAFEEGLKPIIATGASSTPYTAFKRYLSTGSRVRNWYSSDPWEKGTAAYNDIRSVRKMHALVRKRTAQMTPEEWATRSSIPQPWCPALETTKRDFESTCAAPAPGQCPFTSLVKLPRSKLKLLNQGEMAITQFAFVGLTILSPEAYGIHCSEAELEAFCHLWRGIGYLLGIEDEYNFCRGTLDDVRARSRDFLEYWVKPNFRSVVPAWEHMMRCVIQGLQYYFPGSTYETCLLDLAQVMNLHMPRLYNSLSYSTWIRHRLVRFYFTYGSKLPKLRSLMNHRLEKALERAHNFDEQKHKELEEKSAKTLESYAESQKNKDVGEKPRNTWALRFFVNMMTLDQ